MDWTELIAWIGWVGTAGYGAYRLRPVPPPVPPPPDPVTDGWRCVIQADTGAVESVRRINDGSAPTRIERGHGHKPSQWYRLVAVHGLSLIYRPEASLPKS